MHNSNLIVTNSNAIDSLSQLYTACYAFFLHCSLHRLFQIVPKTTCVARRSGAIGIGGFHMQSGMSDECRLPWLWLWQVESVFPSLQRDNLLRRVRCWWRWPLCPSAMCSLHRQPTHYHRCVGRHTQFLHTIKVTRSGLHNVLNLPSDYKC